MVYRFIGFGMRRRRGGKWGGVLTGGGMLLMKDAQGVICHGFYSRALLLPAGETLSVGRKTPMRTARGGAAT